MRFKNTSLDASGCRRRPTEMMAWYSDDVDTHLLVGLSIKNFYTPWNHMKGIITCRAVQDGLGLRGRMWSHNWLLECEEQIKKHVFLL